MDSKENPEHTVEHCLFDKKLRFPSLEEVDHQWFNKLMAIWHSPTFFREFQKSRVEEAVVLGEELGLGRRCLTGGRARREQSEMAASAERGASRDWDRDGVLLELR
ncbi:hypothetical protein M0R45_035973 [Rubus argutus]|uniref:Uncharacterized protein n=1 Tax=Rubus argutus TaxID=59490 RepID=A0AAW1VZE4_RUBAR